MKQIGKKVIAAILALTLLLSLAGCSTKSRGPSVDSEGRVTVNVGLLLGPSSMGLGWMMNEVEQGNTVNNFNLTVDGTDYATVTAALNSGDYDIVNCPSNIAAIMYNNKDLKEKVKVISINNTGLLYLMTTDPSVRSLQDLNGKTVYAIGEGGPPEYTFKHILEKNGMIGSVNLSFRSTPFEVLNLLEQEKNSIALLPQPFVETAKTMVSGLKVPIDVTTEWNKAETKAETITTVSIVREEFLKEHESAVEEYLSLAKKSTDYTLTHVDQAAEWTDIYGTFLNPEIAKKAIPQCNIVTITGEEMKTKLGGFLQILYAMNPESVGGKVPDDGFYYIPKGTK